MHTAVKQPNPAEILRRTAEIAPIVRARALETEQLRRIPDQTIALLNDAGLFKLYQPARWGGYELPYGWLQLGVSSLLGAACGSTAWVQSVFAIHAWMLASFSDEAQAAVWAETPDARISTSTSTVDGTARIVDGGVLLDGTWQFSSGVDAVSWIVLRAAIGDTTPPSNRWLLVPKASVEVVDVWRSSGLRGTGSQDIRLREVYVPDAFGIDIFKLRGSSVRLWGLPYMGVFQFAISAPSLGVARGALDAFRADAMARPDRQAQVSRQLRYAMAAADIDAAELLMARTAADFDATVAAGGRLLGTEDRVRFKRDASRAAHLCWEAVGRLVEVSGAHGLADSDPLQRAYRDIIAIASHRGLSWDTSGELYARVAFGLRPTDPLALPD